MLFSLQKSLSLSLYASIWISDFEVSEIKYFKMLQATVLWSFFLSRNKKSILSLGSMLDCL